MLIKVVFKTLKNGADHVLRQVNAKRSMLPESLIVGDVEHSVFVLSYSSWSVHSVRTAKALSELLLFAYALKVKYRGSYMSGHFI